MGILVMMVEMRSKCCLTKPMDFCTSCVAGHEHTLKEQSGESWEGKGKEEWERGRERERRERGRREEETVHLYILSRLHRMQQNKITATCTAHIDLLHLLDVTRGRGRECVEENHMALLNW